MKKSIFLATAGILLFTGCCKRLELVDCNGNCQSKVNQQKFKQITLPKPKPVVKNNNECLIKNGYIANSSKGCVLKLHASGVGVVPCNGTCSSYQAVAMARRAAILDAYKVLAEKLYGIKINGSDTVKNMVLQNSNIKAYVEGVIRGANIEQEEFKNGIYKVVMSLKIDVKEWNKFLKRNNLL
jgi:hypothetical protein